MSNKLQLSKQGKIYSSVKYELQQFMSIFHIKLRIYLWNEIIINSITFFKLTGLYFNWPRLIAHLYRLHDRLFLMELRKTKEKLFLINRTFFMRHWCSDQ